MLVGPEGFGFGPGRGQHAACLTRRLLKCGYVPIGQELSLLHLGWGFVQQGWTREGFPNATERKKRETMMMITNIVVGIASGGQGAHNTRNTHNNTVVFILDTLWCLVKDSWLSTLLGTSREESALETRVTLRPITRDTGCVVA